MYSSYVKNFQYYVNKSRTKIYLITHKKKIYKTLSTMIGCKTNSRTNSFVSPYSTVETSGGWSKYNSLMFGM